MYSASLSSEFSDSSASSIQHPQKRRRQQTLTIGQFRRSFHCSWFTNTLYRGSTQTLTIDDLPSLPHSFESEHCVQEFLRAARALLQQSQGEGGPSIKETSDQSDWLNQFEANSCFEKEKFTISKPSAQVQSEAKANIWPLLRLTFALHGRSFMIIMLMKLLVTALSFAGPVLLGEMVSYLEDGATAHNLLYGVTLVLLLAASAIVSSILNTNTNIRYLEIKVKLQAVFTLLVYSRALSIPTIAWKDLRFSEAQINNFIQIDVEQISNFLQSFNDIWSLPLQIIVAFILLYLQIKIAFLAGIFVIILMIPFNSYIAKRIGANTDLLLQQKDQRLKLITEGLNNMISCKMSGLERVILQLSAEYRRNEVKYLSNRKYLDAVCVFLWATTPVLVPFFTFLVAVLTSNELKPANVITTIALLNMLIFPMNALPWIVNGFMEAKVSLQRIGKLVNQSNNQYLHVPALLAQQQEFGVASHKQFFSPVQNVSAVDRSFLTSADSHIHREFHKIAFIVQKNKFSWISYPPAPNEEDGKKKKQLEPATDSGLSSESFQVSITDNLICRFGEMKAIVGITSSGKSTFLLGILGEIRRLNPVESAKNESLLAADYLDSSFSFSSAYSHEAIQLLESSIPSAAFTDHSTGESSASGMSSFRVSYCGQVPAIFTGTVRNNIIMGSEHDLDRYHMIVDGCCLLPDFDSWNEGDSTEVGQQGAQLSGGQRLRIGIARALYASSDLVILDDPFSALDETTRISIRDFLIQQILIKEKRSVLVATHTVHLLSHPMIPEILILNQGEELERGNYDELLESSSMFRALIDAEHQRSSADDPSSVLKNTANAAVAPATLEDMIDRADDEGKMDNAKSAKPTFDNKSAADGRKLEEEAGLELEKSKSGVIEWTVYSYYFASTGIIVGLITVLSTFFMQAANISMTFWLGYWSTHQSDYSDREFLIVTSMIVVANMLFAIFRSFFFAYGGLSAAKSLYDRLSVSILSTDILFFERTAIGQISNRISKDTNAIDDDLPFVMNILLAMTFLVIGSTFMMVYNDPMILVILVFVAIVYYRLQRFYRLTSRELRRLDSVYRSPVYTIFSDSMKGAIELRVLGEKSLRYTMHRLYKSVNDSIRVSTSVNIASQWLNIRMQLLGAFVTTTLAFSIVLNDYYHLFPISAGLAGLSLSYSFSIVGYLNGFINTLTETEQEMVSVERVLEYSNLPSEYLEGEDSLETVYSTCESWQVKTRTQTAQGSFWQCCAKSPQKKGKFFSLVGDVDGDGEDDEDQPAALTDALLGKIENGDTDNNSVLAAGRIRQIKQSQEYWDYIQSVLRQHCFFPPPSRGTQQGICFQNMSMKYPNALEDALRDVSLFIEPGSRIAVVGRTGSGKSSLLRCLLRLNEYYSGSVTFSSFELKAISKQLLRKTVSVLPQRPLVFSGTIRINVDPLGVYSDEEVMIALYESSFLSTIPSLAKDSAKDTASNPIEVASHDIRVSSSERSSIDWSKGVELTIQEILSFAIQENGENLSWGQKQLLCLARALLRRSDLILIDEVSASLDVETKVLVFSALERHVARYPSTILLMISHHLEGIEGVCNKILRLDNGRVTGYEDLTK